MIAGGGKGNPCCYDTSFYQSSDKEQLINPGTMSAHSFKVCESVLSWFSFSGADICPRNNTVCSGDGVQYEQCLASDDSMYARTGGCASVYTCFVCACLLVQTMCYYVVLLADML